MTAVNSQAVKKTVVDLLKDVSSRNRDIISRRFGLKTGKKETLESIGASYKITRERVRQIEEATLRQLSGIASGNAEVARYLDAVRGILNAKGGIDGRKVEIAEADDESNPDAGRRVAETAS